MHKRKAMTPARKKRIYKAHDGKCWRCKEPFKEGEAVEYDHMLALARGGTDDDENIGPCHVHCHKLKTFGGSTKLGSHIYEIAKTKRLKKKHKERKKPKNNWPKRKVGSLKYKKKVDGTVVLRNP